VAAGTLNVYWLPEGAERASAAAAAIAKEAAERPMPAREGAIIRALSRAPAACRAGRSKHAENRHWADDTERVLAAATAFTAESVATE